jgi:hypothetical protein
MGKNKETFEKGQKVTVEHFSGLLPATVVGPAPTGKNKYIVQYDETSPVPEDLQGQPGEARVEYIHPRGYQPRPSTSPFAGRSAPPRQPGSSGGGAGVHKKPKPKKPAGGAAASPPAPEAEHTLVGPKSRQK